MDPYIPRIIMTIFQNDYPFIQELIEYKRDGALLFLKLQGAIAFYGGNFGLDVKKDVKDWEEFMDFSRLYARYFVQEGLKKYQMEERDIDDKKKKYQILDMGILGPAIEIITKAINKEHLEKFPKWPIRGTQEDYIELNVKSFQETSDLRIYWLCRGKIFVKNTTNDYQKIGCNYRAEFSGKPEFQLSYFNLDKIRQCNAMARNNMNKIKNIVDHLEEKYFDQIMSKLLINIDI